MRDDLSQRPAPQLHAGTRLGPYEVVELLGVGGMGEVYRGRDPRLGREVAIKVLPVEVGQDAARLRRFEQEARAASALNHPNILTVFDVGSIAGTSYLVTELLEGSSLRSRLQRAADSRPGSRAGSGLPLRTAVEWATEIARGLAAAHQRGIVHHDLKPENVFVTEDGRLKILDFGLAKHTGESSPGRGTDEASTEVALTTAGTILGTVATCPRNRCAASRPAPAPTSSPSAACSTSS